MAFSFGDGFDLYAGPLDPLNGYWDGGANPTNNTLTAGRFAGSQCLVISNLLANSLFKNSGANDAVHHLVCAFRQITAIGGTVLAGYLQLLDGATAQCSIVFRSDGAILLTSGTAVGTVLATYTGAFPLVNTWYAFEFEVIINNTTGRFRVRKNGNAVDDLDSGAVLNTRVSANNYANRMQIGMNAGTQQNFDDLFWRSDASSVPWMGDIRCITRMPASDASAQFSRIPTTLTQVGSGFSSNAVTAGEARYVPFVSTYSGTVGSLVIQMSAGYTGNLKACIFASSGGVPTTPLGSTTVVSNPITGSNTFVFSTPATVVAGTTYFVSAVSDTTSGSWNGTGSVNNLMSTTSYASFPASSPTTSAAPTWGGPNNSVIVTENSNYRRINEAQQDALTSYVYDTVVGHSDLYSIAAITATPSSTIAVTTRAYVQKTDAGTRSGAVQLKSGATTVQSPAPALTVGQFTWLSRTDTMDPNTGAAWTASAVNNAQIGPVVVT